MNRYDLIGQTGGVPLYYNRRVGRGLRPMSAPRLMDLATQFSEYAKAEAKAGNVTMAKRLAIMAAFIDRALNGVPFPET